MLADLFDGAAEGISPNAGKACRWGDVLPVLEAVLVCAGKRAPASAVPRVPDSARLLEAGQIQAAEAAVFQAYMERGLEPGAERLLARASFQAARDARRPQGSGGRANQDPPTWSLPWPPRAWTPTPRNLRP